MVFDLPEISGEQNNKRWPNADDNVIQTFQIESSQLRGRMIRLGSVLDEILDSHNYPESVAHLTAETLTLALLLSSMLKYEGIFTLQAKGDGPVGMLVADVTSAGDIRACATFDAEKAAKVKSRRGKALESYLGKGYLAFTVDQGENTERYQGIVELKASSLVESVHHYFSQSEQIGTGIRMAVAREGGKWRAGGIMLQHLPEDGPVVKIDSTREEDWRRAMVLMNTCKDSELLDADLHSNELLLRLFHEDGVRVYAPAHVQNKCRCSGEKIESLFMTMKEDDINYLAEDGKIKMNCEFCNRDYIFDQQDLLRKMKVKKPADT